MSHKQAEARSMDPGDLHDIHDDDHCVREGFHARILVRRHDWRRMFDPDPPTFHFHILCLLADLVVVYPCFSSVVGSLVGAGFWIDALGRGDPDSFVDCHRSYNSVLVSTFHSHFAGTPEATRAALIAELRSSWQQA